MKTLNDLKTYTKDDISRKDFIGIALQTRTKEASKKGLACKVDMSPTFIFYQGLRELAIKHVKRLESYKKLYAIGMTAEMIEGIREANIREQAVADWIKNFFNITESEIKDAQRKI